MLNDFVLGQTSIVLRPKVRQDTTGAKPGQGFTGLTSSSTGLIISTIADNETTATVYAVAGSTIEAVTTLGTYAAPTATKCRIKKVDDTNHPGLVEIQIADARFAVAGAKSLTITLSGVTGMADCDVLIPLRTINPYSAAFGLSLAKTTNITGFNDIAASAVVSNGAITTNGSGKVSGVVLADTTTTLTTAPTINSINGLAPPTNWNLHSIDGSGRIDVGKILGTASAGVAGYVGLDWSHVNAPTTTVGLSGTTVGTLTTYTGNTVQTGDSYARIGAAGAGLTGITGVALAATQTTSITGNITGNLSGSVGSVTGNLGGNVVGTVASVVGAVGSVAGAVGSVTGAVGSVTGNVGGNVVGNVNGTVTLAASQPNYAPATASALSALQTTTNTINTNVGAAGAGLTSVPYTGPSVGAIQSGLATSSALTTLTTTVGAAGAGLTSIPYTGPSSSTIATAAATATRDIDNTTPAGGSLGAKVNSAASATDPLTSAVPGSYSAGQAGYIIGHNLDAAVSTRLATSGYTAPTNADTSGTTTLLARIPGPIPANGSGFTAIGDARLANLDAAVSTRSTFAGGPVASVAGNVGGNVVGSVGSVAVTDKSGYTLTSAYDPAKTSAQAGTALTNATWTDPKAAFIDSHISTIVYGGTLPCTAAAGSTGAAVIVGGLPTGKNYVGQRLYHYTSAESRTISAQSYVSPNYTFLFNGLTGTADRPFAAVGTGDAVLPVP